MSIILAIVICISDAKSMMMQPAGILAHSSSMGSRAVVLSGWAGYKKKWICLKILDEAIKN